MKPTAFVPSSSFTPRFHHSLGVDVTAHKTCTLQMVTPKHIRRSNEIKRLERQLEELRALREKLGNEKVAAGFDSKPEPPVNDVDKLPLTSLTQFSAQTPLRALEIGKHNERSRFLSISSIDSEEYPPRVLIITGSVPGLTTTQFQSTPSVLMNRRPDKGNVVVTRLPEDFRGEIMAIPGSEVLHKCGDPVIVLAEQTEVSATSLPIAEQDFIALIVDRDMNGRSFNNNTFYVWDVQGHIRVGWAEEEPHPSQAKCVGEVVLGVMEIRPEFRQKKSCWEEENETYV